MKKKLLSPRTPFFAAILALVLLIVPLTGYQDANFEWAKLLGGGGRDYGASIVTDAEGNVYVTGPFYGSIDVNPNTHPTKAFNMTSHPLDFDDIYIVKLDRNGNLVQARQFGGEGRESGTSIARDTQGYIYVTGVFSGPKNVDFGKFPLGTKGNIDIFIIKLDPEKLGVIWAKRMGGTGRDLSWAVAVDPSTNDVCVTGYFQNTADFGPTTTLTGGGAFVCKLDSDGNFKWAKKMGQFHHASITSSGGCDPVVVDSFIVDQGRSVAIDALGNICVTGWFWGNADFDPGQEVSALLSAGGSDVFVVKLDSNGNFRWAKKMGGSGDDEGNSIAVDPLNNDICVASETFVTKLDTDGEEKWTTATGGLCMATDASGNIYVSGGGIVKFNPEGEVVWTKQIGGANAEHYCQSITIDAWGSIFVTGGLNNSTVDFDPGPGVFTLGGAGLWDIFVLKLNQCVTWEQQVSGTLQHLRSVHFISPLIGWAVGANGTILKTKDGGVIWTSQNPPGSTMSTMFNSVHFVSPLNGWVVGANGIVLKTEDGGITWVLKPMGTNTIFNDVFFVNADTGWVVGAGGTIRKTTNGGVTWTSQGAGTTSFNGVYFINADTGWVVGNSGTIRRTTNGGQNWTLHLVPGNPVNLNAIYFVDNHNGWVVGNNGKIFTSENGGAVWDEQSSGTSNHLYGVHFTDSQNGWAAGTVGTISRTTNGGAWNAQSFGVAQTLRAVHFPVDQIGWAVGDNGTIIKYNAAPTATFTWSAQGGNVDFKNTSTGAVSWHWDFGDGIFSNEEHPQHTYTTDGTYTVGLRVANACGTVLTTSQTVTIILPPSPPVAGFTATPTTGCTPLSVQFDANSSGATAWQWIFNGGTPATSTDQNPTVTYTAPGTYTVTLTVSNTAGTDSLTQTNYITVNTPPTADFTLNANGFNVTLNNQSVNAISYVWDAPGGTLSNSTAVNPTVTYTGPGTYKVTLTASNACGTGAAMQSVTILPPAPRRLYVDHEAGGTNDGSSWENAFRRLQDALNTAISGDTIWVAEGTYLPTETYGGAGDRYRAFNITGKGVAIFGGFNATETLLSQRDWKKYPTSLSGDIGVPGDAADNAYHVIYMRDLPPTARLDGFTVTGGRADSSGSEDSGGGVFNTGSSASNPTFVNCIFTGNSAVQLGGAMLNSSKTGVVSLINCIFSRNSANYGGAMFNEGSGNLALINCVFWDNSAANWGGAMLNISLNSLIATNCTFSGNWAAIQGVSMANLFLNVTTTNCIFWGERAGTDPVFYNFSSSVTAGHCLTDASDCNALGAGVTCGPGMHFDTDPMFADTSNGDLRLQSCSPAIDAGLDSAVPAGMITDLAGKSRYFKSTTLLQATVDIGAYEYQGQKAPCSGLTLFVGSACGAPGDILVIPVTVQGFTNIAAIQGTVSLIPGPFSPIGVQSNTSAAMSANPSGNAMSWLWWNTPSGGMTLSPGDTLFFVLVQVDPAALPGSGPVVAQIDSTLLNLKAFQPPNNPVPVTAVGGDFCVLDEILVCGVVASENGQGVESVQVTITNISNSSVDTVLTGPDGIYQQGNLNAGKDYLVEPSKSGANPGCIDVLSVWLLNQILLGNMPYVSNYQKIAADVLTDKVINWSDLFALIDLIQNNTSLNWRFHAVHHPLPLLDQTAVVPHLNEYYELLNLSADTCGLDFIAIPLGALAGPANCYTGNTAVARADALDIQVETAWREKDGLFEVRLKGLSRSDIIALQAPLRFDETQLEFLRVEPGCFDGWTNGTIPHPWAERGLLPLVWFASGPAANGCTGADGDVLCSLVFRLRPGARPESLGLDMFEKGMPARAYTTDRTAMEIRLSESLIKSDAPRLLRNRPNPFAEETVIPVYLPANTVIAEVRITDLLGREIEHFWIEGRGELSVPFRYDGYRPGVLFYSLFVDGKLISTQRMVVQYADK